MAVPPLDWATLDAARKRAEDARAFWDAHRAELTQQYPNEFVAMRNGETMEDRNNARRIPDAHGPPAPDVN